MNEIPISYVVVMIGLVIGVLNFVKARKSEDIDAIAIISAISGLLIVVLGFMVGGPCPDVV